ncbi:MAG: efflux RND transporter permease subunit [Gammaproteobacteria bacterium]|nr:efflux RND transporter permease subunit [Gammaproteobacteria bacterium]
MHRAISWFTQNSVAANLLMFILLLGGALGLATIHQEEFPNIDADIVTVTVPYLGAAPEEAEQGVCIRIEEAVEGIAGIEKIYSTASEGLCSVRVQLLEDVDATRALNEIKSQVDAISAFPVETEKPVVSKMTFRSNVVEVAISGATDERTLKEIAKEIRDDIAAIDGISQVDTVYIRPYEISIEVPEYMLRRYGLTLEQVSAAVRRTSLNMPGGTLRTQGGEILLRTKGQAYVGAEFEDIVIITREDGTQIRLSEIAQVIDGFEQGDLSARFDGQAAAIVKVFRINKEDITTMARDVRAYVAKKRSQLPQGIELSLWSDSSKQLDTRVATLLRTAGGGLVLVLIVLALFLRFRLAMWVAAGIPIALLGTTAMFPYFDISISTMTVMAFILVLGIVVDDAIVVGERVYAHEELGKRPIRAAIDGTWEVSVPVIFGVLTTMAAFLPLLIVPGRMADFFGVIGTVVIIALVVSIIESQLILPAHLAHRKRDEPTGLTARWNKIQDKFAGALQSFANDVYLPFLRRAITWWYVTAATGVAILVLAMALIYSGRVIFSFFPSIDGDRLYATLELPQGVAATTTREAAKQIEAAAQTLRAELDVNKAPGVDSVVRHVLVSVGTLIHKGGPPRPAQPGKSHFAEIGMELVPLEERGFIIAKDIVARWRELVGDVPDAVSLTFSASTFDAGEPINLELTGRNVDDLRKAAVELKSQLSRYDGVIDITDSFRAGKQEIQLELLPGARNLGLTLNDLARQVRSAFYGTEVQRVQRGPDEVRVMVRFPDSERRSIGNLEDMRIRTPDGSEVPFTSVASFNIGRGYSQINRVDGQRVINVTADVDRSIVTPEEVNASVMSEALPSIMAIYPSVTASQAGEQEQRSKAMGGLAQASLLSLVIIYALLAIPLRSYLQPLVIMSVIPFGAVGAIVGHYIMGHGLMFFSMLGIVALSGVVVNASLVLVDFINRRRREGVPLEEAVMTAGVVRFRPIVLTSTTTFVGLLPLMFNTNPSTFFIIPMAISLAFGVLFATSITLVMVPSLYMIAEDFFEWGALHQEDEVEAQKQPI